MLSSPVEHSGWWCVDRRDRWPLQVDYSTNRKEVVPQVLAWPAATVSLPGGEWWMTICPPAWPFTACLTALALGECWARRDWAGPDFNRRGSLCVCVCVLFPQHCGRPGAGPSGQSASQSVCCCERYCSIVLYYATILLTVPHHFTWMLFSFSPLLVTKLKFDLCVCLGEEKNMVLIEIWVTVWLLN